MKSCTSEYLAVIISGVAGTAAKTLFLYLITWITGLQLKVVKILGTMLTGTTTSGGGLSEKSSAILIGLIVHYLVGITFSLVYILLWKNEVGAPTLKFALVAGILTGLFGAGVWKGFIVAHKNPPKLDVNAFLLALIPGHLVFALVLVLIYHFLCGQYF